MSAPTCSRNILVAVTGLAPQIVTETLYALAVARPTPLVPDEIHILTTTEGANRAKLTLLSRQPGWFHRLRADYDLPPIHFDEGCIHVLKNAEGEPLDDVRSPDDNEQLADFIAGKMRHFTSDPDSALHVTIAGGRKTMGFYLGYALSLYGRAQDRLSHVLISPPFENHPEFFYPTPNEHVIFTQGPNSRPLDAAEAEVTLAEIPFVRLRANLPQRMRDKDFRFAELVDAAQAWERPPHLRIGPEFRHIVAGGESLRLTSTHFAVYSWLATRAAQGLPPVDPLQPGMAEAFLDHYRSLTGEMAGWLAAAENALAQGMERAYLSGHMSRINKRLRHVLGETTAEPYLIQSFGEKNHTAYGLGLDAGAIEVG